MELEKLPVSKCNDVGLDVPNVMPDDEAPTHLHCQPAMFEGGDDESSAGEERRMDASAVEANMQVPEEFNMTSNMSKDQAPSVVVDEEDIQCTDEVAESLNSLNLKGKCVAQHWQ